MSRMHTMYAVSLTSDGFWVDVNFVQYTTQVMWCDLAKPSGDQGGYLVGHINNEDIVLYKEKPNTVDI